MAKLRQHPDSLESNTLVLFTSDNGPWLRQGLSSGTAGLLTGQYAGYHDTGKGVCVCVCSRARVAACKSNSSSFLRAFAGSTWEGGIRMPAFAYWKGKIQPYSRSAEVVSSLDIFPTLSKLAGIPSLPTDRVYDGRDMSHILLSDNNNDSTHQNDSNNNTAKSKHDFLFFYGFCNIQPQYSITAVRHGKYKAHWCTAPGFPKPNSNRSQYKFYHGKYPLLFNVEKDPAESTPLSTGDRLPRNPDDAAAMKRIVKAYAFEKATFSFDYSPPAPDGPGEGPGHYGLCCDRSCNCNCDSHVRDGGQAEFLSSMSSLFQVGSKEHHDKYHDAVGEPEPFPPQTTMQQHAVTHLWRG